jgi:hypothetical protein
MWEICFAQDIQFGRLTREQVLEYEKLQDGSLKDSGNYSMGINPLLENKLVRSFKTYIFQRTKDDFDPQLHVWYYFDLSNDTLAGIRYNWGIYNPDFNPSKNRERLEELTKKELAFSEKYRSITRDLEAKFGPPKKSSTIADNKNSFIEQVFWEDEEKVIELAIRFERKLNDVSGAWMLADFRIEVMVTWK